MLTDGRVVTGVDAAKNHLVEEVGGIDDAIAKAKDMAHVQRADIYIYKRSEADAGSVYAKSPAPTPGSTTLNIFNVDVDQQDLLYGLHPECLYLWNGQD